MSFILKITRKSFRLQSCNYVFVPAKKTSVLMDVAPVSLNFKMKYKIGFKIQPDTKMCFLGRMENIQVWLIPAHKSGGLVGCEQKNFDWVFSPMISQQVSSEAIERSITLTLTSASQTEKDG